jgi:glucose/arabinose dehydrogenase
MLNRFFILALCVATAARAGELKPPAKYTGPKPTHVDSMQWGPFFSYSIGRVQAMDGTVTGKEYGNKECVVLKGIVVPLTPARDVNVVFDTDLLRYAVGWSGGFLDLSRSNAGQYKGDEPPSALGTARWGTQLAPGVGPGEFKDERGKNAGPLPESYAHYKGLYVHDGRVIFSYSVGGRDVLDSMEAFKTSVGPVFVRRLRLAAGKTPVIVALFDAEQLNGITSGPTIIDTNGDTVTYLTRLDEMISGIDNAGGRAVLHLPASVEPVSCAVMMWSGKKADSAAYVNESAKIKVDTVDLASLCKGGKPQWNQPVETVGNLGSGEAPYVVDTITLPDKNPWNSWMRIGAFDFFADGTRAALCTLNGDVWIVSGIDAGLQKLTWQRFATGLYEPLGLKIVDEQIYVLGRDQITRLHDLNGDGMADYYENFCNQWNISPSYHAFSFELWTDKDGNFYFTNCGNQVEINLPGHGVMFKVSKDGKRISEVAHGLRAPNGMALGPNGEIVCSDNEGFWMPSSKINWIKSNGFFGFPGDPRKLVKDDPSHQYVVPTTFEPPLCWIPHKLDTSSGGEAFVTSDKWGPFKGHMIHTSYGTATLYLVMTEDVGGTLQGGTVKFPLTFPSGIMRARFNDKDGQLYLAGLRGWQTTGVRDGTFCRVRYTGKPVCMPVAVKTHPRGLDITFSEPLDQATATDAENWAVEQWNYQWSAKYGSPDFKVSDPKEKGHDSVPVQYINLSADKKTVSLSLPDVKPVMQMGLKFKIKSADGASVQQELDYTIHRVGQ